MKRNSLPGAESEPVMRRNSLTAQFIRLLVGAGLGCVLLFLVLRTALVLWTLGLGLRDAVVIAHPHLGRGNTQAEKALFRQREDLKFDLVTAAAEFGTGGLDGLLHRAAAADCGSDHTGSSSS